MLLVILKCTLPFAWSNCLALWPLMSQLRDHTAIGSTSIKPAPPEDTRSHHLHSTLQLALPTPTITPSSSSSLKARERKTLETFIFKTDPITQRLGKEYPALSCSVSSVACGGHKLSVPSASASPLAPILSLLLFLSCLETLPSLLPNNWLLPSLFSQSTIRETIRETLPTGTVRGQTERGITTGL